MLEIELDGYAIIASWGTGVAYVNQAGGTCCEQKSLEGFAIPFRLGLGVWEKELEDYFTGPPHWGSGGSLTEADADFIDKRIGPCYRVDRSRLGQSTEAWVHVTPSSGCGFPYGLVEGSVVFAWPNSD